MSDTTASVGNNVDKVTHSVENTPQSMGLEVRKTANEAIISKL